MLTSSRSPNGLSGRRKGRTLGEPAMQQYILRRVPLNLLVILLVATIVFLLLRINSDYVVNSRCMQEIGTDPEASEDVCDLIRKELGLDGSVFEQDKTYVGELGHFGLGESFQAKD